VTDESGAVLSGVSVTATSPALQVPQVIAATDQEGRYRLAPLPIGTYNVTFELAGFKTVRREDIRLIPRRRRRVAVCELSTLLCARRADVSMRSAS